MYDKPWLREHRRINIHEIQALGLSEEDVMQSFWMNLRQPGTPVPIKPPHNKCYGCGFKKICGTGEERVYCESILEGE